MRMKHPASAQPERLFSAVPKQTVVQLHRTGNRLLEPTEVAPSWGHPLLGEASPVFLSALLTDDVCHWQPVAFYSQHQECTDAACSPQIPLGWDWEPVHPVFQWKPQHKTKTEESCRKLSNGAHSLHTLQWQIPITYQICEIVSALSCHQTVRESKSNDILHIRM